jgi:hypothetical protein
LFPTPKTGDYADYFWEAYYEISKADDPAVQEQVAARVVSVGLSRDETVEVVRQVAEKKRVGKPRAGGSKAKGRGANKPKSP